MARPKTKDIRYMNVSLDRKFYEKFSKFCEGYGMSKTGATEKALEMYMNMIDNAVKDIQSTNT